VTISGHNTTTIHFIIQKVNCILTANVRSKALKRSDVFNDWPIELLYKILELCRVKVDSQSIGAEECDRTVLTPYMNGHPMLSRISSRLVIDSQVQGKCMTANVFKLVTG
jgi:hypothetical protein